MLTRQQCLVIPDLLKQFFVNGTDRSLFALSVGGHNKTTAYRTATRHALA